MFAATVNRTGSLTCRAEKTGGDTALSLIIRMVADAGGQKAPIARIADRVAAVFVPVVLGIAAVTFLCWKFLGEQTATALERAVAVLVISCPCALGLATPVAIMTGNGAAARNGILFKTAVSLEQTGRVKTVAFDKTGTLTKGELTVTGVFPEPGVEENALLAAAATVENGSEHPIARAVLSFAEGRGIRPEKAEEFLATGSRVSCQSEGRKLSACGVPEPGAALSTGAAAGRTPVYVTADGRPLGLLEFADTIRPEAAQTVQLLSQMGVKSVLITGDNEQTAASVGKEAGIAEIYAGVLPGEKADIIRKLQENGPVMMVGDGINDAIALKTADIGAGLRTGTDIAMDAADVVLMREDITAAADTVRFSRAVIRNIHQNLFWAFFYNSICIPLAAGCFLKPFGIAMSPVLGAACMSLSSLFVVTNALRLSKLTKTTGENQMKTQELKIEGMMCPHCEARVKEALLKVPGVVSAEVSHEKGNALVTGEAAAEALRQAVTDAGYKVL